MVKKSEIRKKKHIIRRADVILLCIFLLATVLLFARPFLTGGRGAAAFGLTVTVRQDGKVTGRYPLNRNRTITLNSGRRHNVITIKDGSVSMEESSCKNQVCVDQGRITRAGQSIICLPNRVVIEISGNGEADGEEDDGVDAVAQ